jgi:hypothetical protein
MASAAWSGPPAFLAADELIGRICAAFDCPHTAHLAMAQEVA